MVHRFTIKRSWVWRWLLVLCTATHARSFVEVRDDGFYVQFGWWRVMLPWGSIASAERVKGRWWWGIGWRSDLRRTVALLGALNPVVLVSLAPPVRTRLFGIPLRLIHLYVSVDDPDGLLRALALHGPSE